MWNTYDFKKLNVKKYLGKLIWGSVKQKTCFGFGKTRDVCKNLK